MKAKTPILILSAVAGLLLIPLLAMQFTNEVVWTFFDFAVMGILLLGTAFLGEFVWRKVPERRYRILALLVILGAFILIWAELAVGIFGTPFAGS